MTPGTRLGPYEIVSLLGAGGMGEVYRARDTRLQREVAIKVLPASLAHDAARRARFERETQAVAALSHANILAIFDTGIHDDQLFAVTELLDGETLRDRLAGGALPMKAAIDIATQTARGLAAAHEKGIVHRDLKPENVFLVGNGQAKILDFGLATTSPTASQATQTLAAMTEPGVVMGTVGYMSPEQLRGQPLDHRTDLFALGAVLYEMLTGTRAFQGDTPADVASAVLREEPPEMASRRSDLPPALERIVRHCLERHPADRFQSARDVAFALEMLSGSAVAATAPPQPTAAPRVRFRTATIAAACVAAGVLAGMLITVASSRRRTDVPTVAPERRPAPVLRTTINLPADTPLALGSRLMTVGFDSPAVALSPDGSFLSYISRSGQGTAVSLVELKTGLVRTLAGTEGATHSFFSPDSQQLGFLTGDRVKRVAVLGGATRTLCEAVRPTLGRWTADDVVYFSEEYGFAASRVAAEGGRPERLQTLEVGFVSDFLPDGKSILVSARLGINTDHARVMLVDLATGEGTTLVPSGFGARIVARDHLLFGRAGSLFAARFDASLKRLTSDPVLIADGVAMDSLFPNLHAIASDEGLLAFASGGNVAVGRPALVDRAGALEPLDMPPQVYGVLTLAPGARQFAVHVGDAVDHIWIQNLDRPAGRKLASPLNAGWPAWSPDGRRVAVRAWPVGRGLEEASIEVWDAEGAAPAQTLAESKGGYPVSWSATTGFIAAQMRTANDYARVKFFRQDGGSALEGFPGEFPSLSPDGGWVAYGSGETGSSEIFIRSMPDGKIKRQVSTGGGIEPVWSENGELFYRVGRRWFATRVATTPELRWDPDPPRVVFETDFVDTPGVSYDVTNDGQRLLVVRPAGPAVVQGQISLIVNWPGMLK
jgi:serine/threonine protein kinase